MAYTTINKGSSYFNTLTYTGTAPTTQNITGIGFKPDFTWIKCRTDVYDHRVFDIIRGVNNELYTNTTGAASTNAGSLTAFNTDGFSLGNWNPTNSSINNFVAWNWLASNTTTSNTAGSITATVSANTTSGFSVGKTTGTLIAGTITVGHGLGVAPDMVIWKRTDGVSNWQVYHKSTGTGLMQLNNTNAVNTSASYWPAVSSTTFSVANNLYGAGETYVFYCFASIKGFSKFGSYTGNGSADGPFVYTGFKPAFVMVKRTDATSLYWFMFDNKRVGYNPSNADLYANTTDAESGADRIDFLSNGFKCRNASGNFNPSGGTMIYMAFAENPFVTSDGIPVTAR